MTNVLIILIDDVGREVLHIGSDQNLGGAGTYGYPATPNITAMALGGTVSGFTYPGGVMCSRAYAEQLCSPTRATLLTGRHPFRHGVGDIIRDNIPTTQLPLPESELTLSNVLKRNGYVTACFGKWHLADPLNGGSDHPRRAGFDVYAGNKSNVDQTDTLDLNGTSYSAGMYTYPYTENGVDKVARGYHATHHVNLAIEWINDQTKNERDWFCYLPLYSVHFPFDNNATTDPVRFNVPPTDLYDSTTWNLAADPTTDTTPKYMHAWRAGLEAMDKEIGRLIRSIDLTDTLVVFMSDNGSDAGSLANEEHPTLGLYPSTHEKNTPYEPGMWTTLVFWGDVVTSSARTYSKIVSAVDVFPTVLDACNIAIPADIDGASLWTFRTTQADGSVDETPGILRSSSTLSVRDHVYSEWFRPNGPNTSDSQRTATQWCVIGGDVAAGTGAEGTGRYKLLRASLNGAFEFYDLIPSGTYNPMEATNLTPSGVLTGLTTAQRAAYDRLRAIRSGFVEIAA